MTYLLKKQGLNRVNLCEELLKQYYFQVQSWQGTAQPSQQEMLGKIGNVYQNHLKDCVRPGVFRSFLIYRLWISFKRLITRNPKKLDPKGMYLYGPVGRGKTVLMDTVVTVLPSTRKIRWHFTQFMQTIHQLNAEFAEEDKKDQPLAKTIHFLSQKYDFLFLDELEVTEIADAMLLGRLFNGLTRAGVFIFITSNTSPENLYKGGLHYERFVPFAQYLQSVFQVFMLENEQQIDFRLTPSLSYSLPSVQELRYAFNQMVAKEGWQPAQLTVNQRLLNFPDATPNAVWLDFNEVGQKAYGAGDYQEIAQKFSTVFLINVPPFTDDKINAARRFITLIDCFYDQQVILYFHCQAPIDRLFLASHSLGTAYERTISRLNEMQSLSKNQGYKRV